MWAIHCDKCGAKLKIDAEQIGKSKTCDCGNEVEIYADEIVRDYESEGDITLPSAALKPSSNTKPIVIGALAIVVVIVGVLAHLFLNKESSPQDSDSKMSEQEAKEFVHLLEEATEAAIDEDLEAARQKIQQAEAMISPEDEAKYKAILADAKGILTSSKSVATKSPATKRTPRIPMTRQQAPAQPSFLGLTYEQWSAQTMMRIAQESEYKGTIVRYEFIECPRYFRIFVKDIKRDEAKKLAEKVASSFNDHFPLDRCMVSVWDARSDPKNKRSALVKTKSKQE